LLNYRSQAVFLIKLQIIMARFLDRTSHAMADIDEVRLLIISSINILIRLWNLELVTHRFPSYQTRSSSFNCY
jgi:hypothetical protein